MTTAVCKAANILGMREELLHELLTLINMPLGLVSQKTSPNLSPEECSSMLDSLIDEYSWKL